MAGRIEGKVAVITGGTSGIGEATAELFIAEGAKVVIAGRSEEKGQAIADRLGENAIYQRADVMKEEEIKAVIDLAAEKFGSLDILFNNAGGPAAQGLDDVTPESIGYAMQYLFGSVALGIKHANPVMKESGGGSIINNSSIAALRYGQGGHLYAAAKVAVTHYSKMAGVELGPFGIRVNCISPGAIATPIFWGGSARANTLSDEENDRKMAKLQKNLVKATPMRSAGLAWDIATAALFLGSDEGRFVNCHDLVVDGGRTSIFHEPPA
ncbi:MAG: SDR family oxidoreductase [Pseudomonadales bacterium]|jgi:NAD(P)-dependent dehydrogenase (short-subunit alcohol dehydrogenase family)|nr:SDR family oxidoreductase [Pseudomonadales bacterium]MDP7597455.1 SDR family oxidoreductase [Pseudomonadales bacterium]HJN49233.1 SDR family oxidoreductase [Pseudomonadales bacterium]|tara:strand:+ start:1929 stop:2732 length:804 start_codon:yes stop_codon:yes gene_type:complete